MSCNHAANLIYFLQYTDQETSQCIIFGNHCNEAHLIDVAPVAKLPKAIYTSDLDIFAWSPGIPHYTEDFATLDSNQYVMEYSGGPGGPREGECFVFFFYDQVSCLLFSLGRGESIWITACSREFPIFSCREDPMFLRSTGWRTNSYRERSAVNRFPGTETSSPLRWDSLIDMSLTCTISISQPYLMHWRCKLSHIILPWEISYWHSVFLNCAIHHILSMVSAPPLYSECPQPFEEWWLGLMRTRAFQPITGLWWTSFLVVNSFSIISLSLPSSPSMSARTRQRRFQFTFNLWSPFIYSSVGFNAKYRV